MGKITDFQKSIHGMNEQDLKARVKEDELRFGFCIDDTVVIGKEPEVITHTPRDIQTNTIL